MDLTKINTPEDILDFISNFNQKRDNTSCECGMTEELFNVYGKCGCPKCYDHFKHKLQHVVMSYHGFKQHVGKLPKKQTDEKRKSDPIEKQKILKLLYAKALELEDFEKAAEIKKQLDQ